jgi:hypothetical protein
MGRKIRESLSLKKILLLRIIILEKDKGRIFLLLGLKWYKISLLLSKLFRIMFLDLLLLLGNQNRL